MKRYYDKTKELNKACVVLPNGSDTENIIISTDARVELAFRTDLDLVKYDLVVDENNFPILQEFELREDGTRYDKYLDKLAGGKKVPDTSHNLKVAISKKVIEIKQAFDTELNQGFPTSSGIKMDATYDDMAFFKKGIEFCENRGINVDVRDFTNEEHSKTVTEANAILSELMQNYFMLRTEKNKLVDLAKSCAKPNEDGTLKEDALEILSKIEWAN